MTQWGQSIDGRSSYTISITITITFTITMTITITITKLLLLITSTFTNHYHYHHLYHYHYHYHCVLCVAKFHHNFIQCRCIDLLYKFKISTNQIQNSRFYSYFRASASVHGTLTGIITIPVQLLVAIVSQVSP
jgi:hypothetical protein